MQAFADLVIRVLLLPATLQLLGDRTWAFPGWLDRRLPRFALEPPEEVGDATPPPSLAAPAVPAGTAASHVPSSG